MMRRPALPPVSRLAAALAALAAGLAHSPAVRAQCAMCGAAAASGKVGQGLAYSIFFLLGTLFLVVLWLVVLVYRTQQRAARAALRAASLPQPAVAPFPAPRGGPIVPSVLATGHAPAEK